MILFCLCYEHCVRPSVCLFVGLSVTLVDCDHTAQKKQEGLAVASIARDAVVEMTPSATTMRGKFGSEFET